VEVMPLEATAGESGPGPAEFRRNKITYVSWRWLIMIAHSNQGGFVVTSLARHCSDRNTYAIMGVDSARARVQAVAR
jgi:hypothetical protein